MKVDKFSNIHPDLQTAAQKMPNISYSRRTLWLLQLLVRWMPIPTPPKDVRIENVLIPGPDGGAEVRLRLYRPLSVTALSPVLLWLHGGGYVMGKPEMDDQSCANFVRELGITVVSVDYRYAPKHPFPEGLEDSYAALKWVATQMPGVDAARIALGGESAGGGLAAALAQLAHDRREITPVFQLLVYPMLDDRTVLRTEIDDSQSVVWNQKSNRVGWEAYLGKPCGTAEVPAYAVPARRADLSGLPPAWIGVGTMDIFHDEDMAYAKGLRECGVWCEWLVMPGAFHGFDRVAPEAKIVQDFQKAKMEALKRWLLR